MRAQVHVAVMHLLAVGDREGAATVYRCADKTKAWDVFYEVCS